MIDIECYDRTHELSANELHHMQLLSLVLRRAARDGTSRPVLHSNAFCSRLKPFSIIWER